MVLIIEMILDGVRLKERKMGNNEDITSTEKFTGTMDVQEKLKFPEKKLEEYLSDTIPGFMPSEHYNDLDF